MTTSSTEDSAFSEDTNPNPEAQGQAALLLVESLIHSLLDSGALTKAQAMQAINSAFEVKEESAAEEKEPVATLRRSLALLASMRNSIAAHSGSYHPRDEPDPSAGPDYAPIDDSGPGER